MLIQIYESMLNTAKNQKPPSFIEFVFHINKEESKNFWENEGLSNEHQQLFIEWENEGDSRYSKTFYGINFAIQFNHNK